MEEGDITTEIPDSDRIAVITSGDPEEVSLEGYELAEIKDFRGAKVVWMERE